MLSNGVLWDPEKSCAVLTEQSGFGYEFNYKYPSENEVENKMSKINFIKKFDVGLPK